MSAKAVREHYGKTLLARHLSEHGVNVEESPDCNPLAYALVVDSLPGVQALRARTCVVPNSSF